MKTIAICNLKGGVAKTTTTVNVAAILAKEHHKRVLVIDAKRHALFPCERGENARGSTPAAEGRAHRVHNRL